MSPVPPISNLVCGYSVNKVRCMGIDGVFDLLFPGPMTILPLRRLFIERQVQPEMLSFVTTEEVVALFKM